MLNKLLERATGNLPLKKDKLFRPYMIYRLLTEPFGVWCDYHAPAEEAVEEISRYEEMRMRQGVEFEGQWVKENYPEAVKIEPEFGYEALKNSLRTMLNGAPAIHAPQLWDLLGEIYGKADLLVKCNDAPSDLGNYHYRVKEIKRSKNLQEYQILQAAMYNRMLGRIQGYTPPEITIVLKESEEAIPYKDVISKVDDALSKWRQIRDGILKPEPNGIDKTSAPWRVYANKILSDSKDLTLLPDIGPAGRSLIRETLNINSIDELANFSLEQLIQTFKEKTARNIFYHAQAYKYGKTVIAPGTKFKIPRRKRHIYFDFETSDEVHPTEPPHVYLIGAWDIEADRFVYFLGRGANDEERIFNEFIEYVGNPSGCCLYHWTDFEISVMKDVAERHPGLSPGLNRLMEYCIDLKEIIKHQVFLPVPTYSIKSVAPALGFNWRDEGKVDAFESMTLYWDFLKDGDKLKIKKAIDYNEDDCKAMVHTDLKLSEEFNFLSA